MLTGIYAGSFDPITFGHLDIIEKASQIFEKVIVGVTINPNKKGFIPIDDRIKLIEECTKNINNVEVIGFEGLTVKFAEKCNANVLIRGLRNSIDFEYEKDLALNNSILSKNIKTICLFSEPKNCFISSSGVREIYLNNGDLSKFVSQNVIDYLSKNI